MDIILWAAGAALILFVISYFMGAPGFWKLTRKYPLEALEMFRSEDCWRIFETKPTGGYQLPGGMQAWTGPFTVLDPRSGQLLTVFCRASEIDTSQERFVQKFKDRR